MKDLTSIAVTKKTRDELAMVGSKDSTFDDIIQGLIKQWNEKI